MEDCKNKLQTSETFLNNSISTTGSDKDCIFIKTDSTKPIILGGSGALILFKQSNKKAKSVSKVPMEENNFVTDGGLKEKKMKYYNSTVFNKQKSSESLEAMQKSKIKNKSVEELKTFANESANAKKMFIGVKKLKKKENPEQAQKEKIDNNLKTLKKTIQTSLSGSLKKKKSSSLIKEESKGREESEQNSKTNSQRNSQNKQKTRKAKLEDSKNSENEDRPKRNNFISNEKNDKNLKTFNNSSNSNKIKSSTSSLSKILSEKERIELMEHLVKNKEEEIIREVQKEVLTKGKQTNDKIQRKLKYLNEKDMLENIDFEQDEKQESLNEEMNVVVARGSRKNVPSTIQHQNRSQSNNVDQEIPRKPKVDTLDFLARIYHERNENIIEGNSFRQSHSQTRIISNDNQQPNSQNIDETFKFSYKKNLRQPEEIYQFIIQKKEEEKLKAIKLENELNTKNLQILVELAKLNEKIKMTRKVSNPRYVGRQQQTERSVRHSPESNKDPDESTVIDPNEYYYALLESKNIIAPNDNPVTSKSKEEFLEFINSQEENILGKDGQLRKSNDIDNFQEMKNRAMNTIKKANQILENTNVDEIFDKTEEEESKVSPNSNQSNHSTIKVPSSLDQINKVTDTFDLFAKIIKNTLVREPFSQMRALLQGRLDEVEVAERLTMGFEYFTAIIKKTPFERMISYVNKMSYAEVLNALFAPIKRRVFYQIEVYGETKARITHFVNVLEYIIKNNVMQRIYLKANCESFQEESATNNREEENRSEVNGEVNEEEQQNIEAYYTEYRRIFGMMFSSHMKDAFDAIASYKKNNSQQQINSSVRSNSIHYRTFMHENLSEKSFILYPNSFDSHRLHRLHLLIERQRIEAGMEDESNENVLPPDERSERESEVDMEISETRSNNLKSKRNRSFNNEQNASLDKSKEISERSNTLIKSTEKDLSQKNVNVSDLNDESIGQKENLKLKNSRGPSKEQPSPIQFSEEGKNHSNELRIETEEYKPHQPESKKNEGMTGDIDQIAADDIKNTPMGNSPWNKFNNFTNPAISLELENNYALSEQDISADRDMNSDIDWGHTISQSKSSGSQRDFQFNPSNKENSATKAEPKVILEEISGSEAEKKSENVSDDGRYEFNFVDDVHENEDNNLSDLIKGDQPFNELKIVDEEKSDINQEREIKSTLLNSNLIPSSQIKSIESDGEDFFKVSTGDKGNNAESIIHESEKCDRFEEIAEQSEHMSKENDEPRERIENIDEVADQIAQAILEELLKKEIINEPAIVPRKMLSSDHSNLNSSMNSVASKASTCSLFSRPIQEIKRETTVNLYNDKIAAKIIDKIVNELETNFTSIHFELKQPIRMDSQILIQSMTKRDQQLMKSSYMNTNPKPFLNKQKIQEEFAPINKQIREDDNFASDNYYDQILNECMIDAATEMISKQRIYGTLGEPLPWSSRTRLVQYKYNTNSGPKMGETLRKELTVMTNFKLGLITENNECFDSEQLNLERERRLMNNILSELKESEESWKNFEIEETQIKVELSELVLEQLLNEAVEIFEHVQLSRRKPNMYQYKSIYACEDIPRLSFQQYITENEMDNINQ